MQSRGTDDIRRINEDRSLLAKILDVTKFFIGIVDDTWGALRRILSPKIITKFNPFIVGIVGGIVHGFEGYEAAKQLYADITSPIKSQRKTRIVTNSIIVTLALCGLSFAFMYGMYGFSILFTSAFFISVMPFMPAVIPGLLIGIYSAALYRRGYALHRARAHEQAAELALRKFEQQHAQTEKGISYFEQLETKQKKVEQTHEARIEAEREVAFSIVEVVTSTAMVAATVMGAAAILGIATVASFGIAPLMISIACVCIGVGVKIFEKYDEKHDHKYTKGIRNWFCGLWNRAPKRDVGVELKQKQFLSTASTVAKRTGGLRQSGEITASDKLLETQGERKSSVVVERPKYEVPVPEATPDPRPM